MPNLPGKTCRSPLSHSERTLTLEKQKSSQLLSKKLYLNGKSVKMPGINQVQVYAKVAGCCTVAHFESEGIGSINVNLGPDDCVWYTVPMEFAASLEQTFAQHSVFKCQICFKKYDFDKENMKPKCLTNCGHICCETCVIKMTVLNDVEYPFCREETDCPVLYQLKRTGDEDSDTESEGEQEGEGFDSR